MHTHVSFLGCVEAEQEAQSLFVRVVRSSARVYQRVDLSLLHLSVEILDPVWIKYMCRLGQDESLGMSSSLAMKEQNGRTHFISKYIFFIDMAVSSGI